MFRDCKKLTVKVLSIFMVFVMIAGCSSSEGQSTDSSGQSQAPAVSNAAPASSPAPSASEGGKKIQYTFSTGSQGGVYNMVGVGMAKAINENVSDFEIIATVPTSVGQVPGMIDTGDVELGILMSDTTERARAGTGEYEGAKVGSMMMDFGPALNNSIGYVTLADSGITNIKDLEGKIFVIPSEGQRVQVQALLEIAGVDPSRVKWQQASYQQGVDALLDGNVDAVVLNAWPYNGLIDQVAMKKYRWLTIDPDVVKAFNEAYPYWTMKEVPAGTYPQQDYPLYTPSLFGTVYIRSTVPEQHAYEMIKAIMEHNDTILSVYPAGVEVNLDSVKKYIAADALAVERMHPGVLRYYKEVGIIS